MSRPNLTPGVHKHPSDYDFVRITVPGRHGKPTSISLQPADYEELAELALGSTETTAFDRITSVCRECARELIQQGYDGKFSAAIRKRALLKLRGSFDRTKAAGYQSTLFPGTT